MWSYLGSGGDGKEYVLINNDGIEQIMGQKSFNQKIIAKKGISAPLNDKTEPAWSIDEAGNIKGNKVYNAVWNDYAEWFEKENIEDTFEPGDICAWNEKGVVLANKNTQNSLVGVVSNSYGIILGGKNYKNIEENFKEFVPIGLMGRVKVRIKGKIAKGDLITISNESGIGEKADIDTNPFYIIGKALESSNEEDIKKITILIK